MMDLDYHATFERALRGEPRPLVRPARAYRITSTVSGRLDLIEICPDGRVLWLDTSGAIQHPSRKRAAQLLRIYRRAVQMNSHLFTFGRIPE